MECDQWATLYEQERSLRLQIEEDSLYLLKEYTDLILFLQTGGVPVYLEINGVISMYLIS